MNRTSAWKYPSHPIHVTTSDSRIPDLLREWRPDGSSTTDSSRPRVCSAGSPFHSSMITMRFWKRNPRLVQSINHQASMIGNYYLQDTMDHHQPNNWASDIPPQALNFNTLHFNFTMALRKLASEVVSGLGVRCLVSGPCGSSSSVVGPAFASYVSRGFATGTCKHYHVILHR